MLWERSKIEPNWARIININRPEESQISNQYLGEKGPVPVILCFFKYPLHRSGGRANDAPVIADNA